MSWYCHSEILKFCPTGYYFLLVSLAITFTAAGHGGIYIELRRETSLLPQQSLPAASEQAA
jgi:hypothetical protein